MMNYTMTFVLYFVVVCFVFYMISILSKCEPAFVVYSKHALLTDNKKSVIQSVWKELELMSSNIFNRSSALVQFYAMYVDGAVRVGILFPFPF